MNVRILAIILLASLAWSGTSVAATAYISDELTVPLRSGPSGAHRILHRGLPSGTVLEVLGQDEEAGFTQIRTRRGTEGWIRSQYLVSTPIAKVRLSAAERRIESLQNELAKAETELQNLSGSISEQQDANQQSSATIRRLEDELTTLKQLSASAVATHEENLQLQDINARLKDELDDLSEQRDLLEDNATNEGIMLGAGFILLGLIVGVLIKARPQRSAWN